MNLVVVKTKKNNHILNTWHIIGAQLCSFHFLFRLPRNHQEGGGVIVSERKKKKGGGILYLGIILPWYFTIILSKH